MIRELLRTTRMRVKFLLATSLVVGLCMGFALYQGIAFHTATAMKLVEESSRLLLENTYSAMKFPMSVGDSKTVEEQLKGIGEHNSGLDIAITDFAHVITYASQEGHIHNNMDLYLGTEEARQALAKALLTGTPPPHPLVDQDGSHTSMVVLRPILNEPACHHCHSDYRPVLGAVVVKQSLMTVLASIHAARDRLILYAVLTLVGLVVLLYSSFVRLVSRRIGVLESLTSKVAAGDVSVEIHDEHQDSIGHLTNNFNEMVKSIRDRIEYANSLKLAISDPFFIVDAGMRVTFVNEAATRLLDLPADGLVGKACQEVFQSDACESSCPVKRAMATGKATVGRRMTLRDRSGREIPVMTSASVLRDAAGHVLGGYEIIRDLSVEVAAEQQLQGAYRREEEAKKALEARVLELSAVLGRAAHGDFTARGQAAGVAEAADAMDLMTRRINETLDGMVALIGKVKDYTLPVASGVWKISRENANLSDRTQQQAGAMEEISSTLEQLAANIRENLTNVRRADALAKDAVKVAEDGRGLVEKTAQAMVVMSGKSQKIEEMTELINEITFQTNLLSVNAAVEAARAGEHGRGFAVVAEEVRNLAKRSAASAKDIDLLVREIRSSATTAHEWVDRVNDSLARIVQTSAQVSQALEEIKLSSEESASGMGQINKGVLELCDVNEKNTCFAEEIAQEMKSLGNTVEVLKETTEMFVLDSASAGTGAARSPAPAVAIPLDRPETPVPRPPALRQRLATGWADSGPPPGQRDDEFQDL
ncbi:MAG: methyl-accepting chemotaxis protein [Thermodesulfobacteriota bacterium]